MEQAKPSAEHVLPGEAASLGMLSSRPVSVLNYSPKPSAPAGPSIPTRPRGGMDVPLPSCLAWPGEAGGAEPAWLQLMCLLTEPL